MPGGIFRIELLGSQDELIGKGDGLVAAAGFGGGDQSPARQTRGDGSEQLRIGDGQQLSLQGLNFGPAGGGGVYLHRVSVLIQAANTGQLERVDFAEFAGPHGIGGLERACFDQQRDRTGGLRRPEEIRGVRENHRGDAGFTGLREPGVFHGDKLALLSSSVAEGSPRISLSGRFVTSHNTWRTRRRGFRRTRGNNGGSVATGFQCRRVASRVALRAGPEAGFCA